VAAKASVAPSENTSLAAEAPRPGLRRHELGGADEHAAHGQPRGGVAERCDAEVGQVRATVDVEQDVRRLDVTVHDALAVGGRERAEQRWCEHTELGGRQRPVGADLVRQGAAPEVRHDQHDLVVLVDDLEEAHDVGVLQAEQGLGLAADALAGLGHLVDAAVQHQALDRDRLAVGTDREVDDAHSASTEALLQYVSHRAAGYRRDPRRGRGSGRGGPPSAARQDRACLSTPGAPAAWSQVTQHVIGAKRT
jgi:hypothetical protein